MNKGWHVHNNIWCIDGDITLSFDLEKKLYVPPGKYYLYKHPNYPTYDWWVNFISTNEELRYGF